MSAVMIEVSPRTVEDIPNTEKNPKLLVAQVRKSFNSGKTLPIKFRKQQLQNIIKLLEENREEICKLMKEELGRPDHETTIFEINSIINETKCLLYNLDEWAKVDKPFGNLINFFDKIRIYKDPYGVVLVIGAWNFPFNLTLVPMAGAIAAGNCVIIKPSEISRSSANFIANKLPKYLDKECYSVFLGGVSETTELLKERFDYIFFTGSSSVGKIIHQSANKYLTPTTLELGGKNPTYLDDSADILKATRRILWGKCANAGQICIAPDYLLCTKEVEKKFINTAKVVLYEEYFKTKARISEDFAKILTEKHFFRLTSYLRQGKVAVGGDFDIEKRYIQPTILVDIDSDSSLLEEEIFGPILPVINISDVNDAIKVIKSKEKPLTMYIFSKRQKDIDLILKTTSSGGATVNDTILHFIVEQLGFGGVGNSGMGSYHGKNNFDTFTHYKSVLVKDYNPLMEYISSCRYPPYSKLKTKIVTFLLNQRRGIPPRYLSFMIAFVFGFMTAFLIEALSH